MGANKNSFIMYTEWEQHFALLSDKEIGELMKAIFAYAKDKTVIDVTSPMAKMAFSFISAQMDRDASAWEDERKARSEAGRAGGLKSGEARSKRSSASKNEANEALLNLLPENEANEANEAVNVNVNVNVNDDVNVTTTPLPPSKGEEAAEAAVQRDKSDQVSADPVPYEKIKGLYNSICTSLPKIVSVSGKRRKAVSGRWREYKDLAVFETLFRKTQASAFMRGEMGGDWRGPDFDWLMCSSNMAKVLEGKYDDEHDIIPDGGMSYGGAGGFYTNARAYPSQTAGSRDAPRYKYGKVI